jgi:hypothetical protein
MSTASFGQPGYTPDQLAQAASQIRNAPPVDPPSEADIAAGLAAKQAAGPAGITEVDVGKLLAGIEALQARVDSLESERAAGAAVPVVGTAEAMRDLIATHAAHNPGGDYGDLLRLADDAVDAAGNAADSGDAGPVTEIAAKIVRALNKVHPGGGDHHYFRQALGFAEVHLPDAAGQLVKKPARQPVAAVTSQQPPATVVQGSVTG